MPTYEGSDGAELHYDLRDRTSGERDPVLVLPGGAAAHPDYLGDLARLDEVRALAVLHLRGVGRSPAPADPTLGSYWRQADDVEALRTQLGSGRVTLLGHSAGTRLAIAYAAQHPDRVERLVLVTPPAAYLVDVPGDAAEITAYRADDPDFAAAVAAFHAGPDPSSDESFNAWEQAIAPTGYAAWGPVEQAHARSGWWRVDAARAYFSVEPPDDLPDLLAAVRAPVLVVAGAQDWTTGLAPVLSLAELFPDGRTAVVDACGHHPWVEQPEAFRRAVDPFLREA